ncbi:TRAP transporter substrate-binding protein [Futiania mangrovi]|uniref:TRAP transporter substrate-binding protein DctP n=1 Tax=Futiania mangrovi TaxID=2959716 RepID=A0A9J6PAB0_9PROT|nr:TRAP transporter substrate-binding protein DctP [Futiania mangrovii]MCP1336996.1 TRAP transporter substrate-binding protein DctP [Futiania mangrovii]
MVHGAGNWVSGLRRTAGAAALAAAVALGWQAADAEAQMTLQATTVFPESDFSSQVLLRWADLVKQRTEGRIDFRYHWAGSLVGNKTLDGLRDGVVDVAVQFTPYVSGDIIDLGVLDIPFSFPLDAEGLAAFHREVKPHVANIYAKHGSQVVSATPIILPNPLTCSDRFLTGPEQWNGALVRAAGRWQAESIKAWGGSPVVIPPAELYTALERGTANCTLMVYNGVNSLKLFEVAPQITRIDHSIAFGTINVSDAAWSRISEADRKIMQDAGDEIVTWAAQQTNDRLAAVIEDLSAKGAKFCTPSDAEFARLVGAMDKVIDSIRGEVSADGAAIIKIVDSYRKRVTAKPSIGPNNPC